jgi:hypothetical protein
MNNPLVGRNCHCSKLGLFVDNKLKTLTQEGDSFLARTRTNFLRLVSEWMVQFLVPLHSINVTFFQLAKNIIRGLYNKHIKIKSAASRVISEWCPNMEQYGTYSHN